MKRWCLVNLLLISLCCYGNGLKHSRCIALLDMRYTLHADLHDAEQTDGVWDQLHAIATLQGIVNREAPQLYIKYVEVNGSSVDDYWWNKYRQKGEWLADRDTIVLKNVVETIRYYKKYIKGIVAYDSNVASTSDIASAVAGIDNLIAVRYDTCSHSLYHAVTAILKLPVKVWLVNKDGSSLFNAKGMIADTHIPTTGSSKDDPYYWFMEHYMKKGKCNTLYAGYYIDQYWRRHPELAPANHHTLTNHDFFVSRKGFFFDLSPFDDEPATDDTTQQIGSDTKTLKDLLLLAYRQNKGKGFCYIGGFPSWAFKYTRHANGKHGDVESEWAFSELISAYNAFEDADAIGYGALANASFWQHFPLNESYPQKWTTIDTLRSKGFIGTDGKVVTENKYVVFYVGDYDASSWITQLTSSIWDDPNRGKLPMMWCISPVLQERVPMVLHYLRKTATANDYFAAADNGAGYLNPGMLQEPRPISHLPSGLDEWASHSKKYYRKWGLAISGFIIDGNAPPLNAEGLDCYSSFSPNGIVPQKTSMTLLYKEMPILQSDWDVNDDNPKKAAEMVIERISHRPIPFHWFRNILKKPTWYVEVANELHRLDPSIKLVDAPTFFELYRLYLKQCPDAANGRINLSR